MLLNFLAGVGIQRYQDTQTIERPKVSIITNKETLEHESEKDLEKEIRNATGMPQMRRHYRRNQPELRVR